jgi:hypothetical protein
MIRVRNNLSIGLPFRVGPKGGKVSRTLPADAIDNLDLDMTDHKLRAYLHAGSVVLVNDQDQPIEPPAPVAAKQTRAPRRREETAK